MPDTISNSNPQPLTDNHKSKRKEDIMGTYLNPGKAAYEEAVNSEIFVDKSEMILYLNTIVRTKQKYVSVSRPRDPSCDD